VHLFPRRKAGDSVFPEKGRLPVKVDRETIEAMFGMPQPEASRALGVSLTALKQVCRKLGIPRWPYQRPCKRGKRCRSRSQAGTAAPEATVQEAIAIPASPRAMGNRVEGIVDREVDVASDDDEEHDEDDEDLAGMSDDSADSYYSAAETARDSSCFSPPLTHISPASSSGPFGDHRASRSGQAKLESFACPGAKNDVHDDDYDLGWLVTVEDYNEAPQACALEDDLNFELAWRERLAVERQKVTASAKERGTSPELTF
jgi:hypothetical protein